MFQDQNTNRVAKRGTVESGEGGIRTLGTLACTPVFETGPIGHSGTSSGGTSSTPLQRVARSPRGRRRSRPVTIRPRRALESPRFRRPWVRLDQVCGGSLVPRSFPAARLVSNVRIAAAVLLCAVAQGESPPVLWRDDADLHAVQLVGKTVAWAVGDHRAALRSLDGGQSWELRPVPDDVRLRRSPFLIRTTAGPRAARLFRTRDWKQDPFFLQRTQVRRGGGSMSCRCLACTPFDSSAAAKVLPPELPHPNARAGSQQRAMAVRPGAH